MKEKQCTGCKEVKELSEFYYIKKSNNYRSACKLCLNKQHKLYSQENKEKLKEYRKLHYQENKDKIKEYRQENKDKIKQYNKLYKQENNDEIKEYNKLYRQQENKDKKKENYKLYRQENKDKINKYRRERNKTDVIYNIKNRIRSRICEAFTKKGYTKKSKTYQILGADFEIVKKHIERQFVKGMSWYNREEWHIDHIIPLASANTEEELIKLNHYTNLQPLWAEDNLSKNDKIIEGSQTALTL